MKRVKGTERLQIFGKQERRLDRTLHIYVLVHAPSKAKVIISTFQYFFHSQLSLPCVLHFNSLIRDTPLNFPAPNVVPYPASHSYHALKRSTTIKVRNGRLATLGLKSRNRHDMTLRHITTLQFINPENFKHG